MSIHFVHPEFHASVAEVRQTASALAASRTRAAGEVSRLLDGWHGAAATEFAEAWADWLAAAAAVASSLEGLADALVAFQGDLATCDSSSASALAALAGRLS